MSVETLFHINTKQTGGGSTKKVIDFQLPAVMTFCLINVISNLTSISGCAGILSTSLINDKTPPQGLFAQIYQPHSYPSSIVVEILAAAKMYINFFS